MGETYVVVLRVAPAEGDDTPDTWAWDQLLGDIDVEVLSIKKDRLVPLSFQKPHTP